MKLRNLLRPGLIFLVVMISGCKVCRLYNLTDYKIPAPEGEKALWMAFDSIYMKVYCPVDWKEKNQYLKVQTYVAIRASTGCQKKFRRLLYEFWKRHADEVQLHKDSTINTIKNP